MDQQTDAPAQAVDRLAAFLGAHDRAAADPYGTASALEDLLRRTFAGSSEATPLLDRFQREPGNPGVRVAVRGRISEALLNRPEFAAQLDAALARITSAWPHQAASQPSVAQAYSVGNMAAVSNNSGAVSVRQRTIKIGRLQIPVPIFALLLLLGGGLVIGGGVVVINSGSDAAGEYAFYTSAEGPRPELTYFHWTTHADGTLTGETYSCRPGAFPNLPSMNLTGHQDGDKLTMTAHFLVSVNVKGTINGDTLTIQIMDPAGPRPITMHKTTPEQFNEILAKYKAEHRGACPDRN